jgi:hypothetical protein
MRTSLLIFLALLGLLDGTAARSAGAATRPKFIVILTDDQDLVLKYVEYSTGEREVYDLRKDPDELVNLRNLLPKAWLNQLSNRLKALANCAGTICRQIEAQPVPALPATGQRKS